MITLLHQGGWVMWTILLLSFTAWVLTAQKWLQIRRVAVLPLAWADSVVTLCRDGDLGAANDLCLQHDTPLARTMRVALHTAQRGGGWHYQLMVAVRHECRLLRRHLLLIAALASLAPLLGLLGTVLGMIQTFAALTLDGPAQVGTLSDGISVALITTQGGLAVALPILLAHRWLASRVRRYEETVAVYSQKLEAVLTQASDSALGGV